MQRSHPTPIRHIATAAITVFALLVAPSCGGGNSSEGPADSASPADEQAGSKNESIWGVAPSSATSKTPATWLPSMAGAGVTTVRNFHAAPNDDQLTPITAAGMTVVGFLMWSTAANRPGADWTLPVDDLDGWRAYVTDQVKRYKGKVKYWEIWNEPPNFTKDTSPASYGKVVAAAYDAAKAADPSVQLGLAAKSNHVNYLAEAIAAGAADKFDFVTLHPYETAELLPQGWEGQFMSIVPRVRQMLEVMNPAKASVPLWFTEIGISAAPPAERGLGPQGQADALIKIYTMAFAQGVARLYWFEPRDSEGLQMGLTTADGTRRPAWSAMRGLKAALGATPRYVGWTQPDNAWYGFVFRGPQGVVLSAWSRAGESTTLRLGSEVRVVNPRTGASTTTRTPSITDAPILLIAPNGSNQARKWLDEAQANDGKTFPWNGDHSASTSVQLEPGAKPAGVFMKNPPPTTVVNGVAEASLEGTIGACFAVDPTFLSYAYKTTPIRISATVRGHGIGKPGFFLLYESGAPIASTDVNNLRQADGGSFDIQGTSVQQKTWTVPDARFIGLYGYHFCFYSPSLEQSHFSVQRVTVSR
ncbi:hypothetical protein QTH91_15280 [Variovorax dokdonensis]|uniref:Asl1-like glycosyl hydrolase catalytic domain-containing protein n=1 Tax=Variovorax dokdonensis TaxID=344883 RepID=A0ABT7ND53_9BURK|nr:hypothetical protein [Variovorax dokdonensis]MDM0045849.1 hypothetical protein [Variovorax dokdonensis]